MASATCTDWKSRSYEGGWHGWYTDFTNASSDGYCWKSGSSTTYAFCFSFKTPSASRFHKSTSLSVTIPIVRTSTSFAKSGTLYFKLLTSDPTGGSITDNLKPSSSNYDASCSWSVSDQQVHKVSFTISSTSLKPDTTYYITVGGSKIVGIGYKGYTPANSWWSATLNYETYTDVTASKPTITDNKNSTFTIQASAGSAGTNNAVNSTTLYYRIGDSGSYASHSSLTKAGSLTCAASAASQKVYAYTKVDGTHNDPQSSTAEATIINYQPPKQPGKPVISYNKSRLTLKENWTLSWGASTAANGSSPVKGYRIRISRKPKGSSYFTTIALKGSTGNDLTTQNQSTTSTDLYYDRERTDTSMTIYTDVNDFEVGDQVKVGIHAYTRNGKNTQLFSGYTESDTYTIQNAGIVNVKVNNTWVEGQVWVKANDEWHEAETVNVKTDSGWMESQ